MVTGDTGWASPSYGNHQPRARRIWVLPHSAGPGMRSLSFQHTGTILECFLTWTAGCCRQFWKFERWVSAEGWGVGQAGPELRGQLRVHEARRPADGGVLLQPNGAGKRICPASFLSSHLNLGFVWDGYNCSQFINTNKCTRHNGRNSRFKSARGNWEADSRPWCSDKRCWLKLDSQNWTWEIEKSSKRPLHFSQQLGRWKSEKVNDADMQRPDSNRRFIWIRHHSGSGYSDTNANNRNQHGE